MNLSKQVLVIALFSLLAEAPEASAFGRRRKVVEPDPVVTGQQAIPFRHAELTHVTVPAFYLPNGTRADFNADLDTIFATTINTSRHLRTREGGIGQPSRVVIVGGVTSLEIDVLQFGVKIGWNRSGPIPVSGIADFNGEVDMRISNLTMDFRIYDRVTGNVYVADYTNESLSNLKLQFKVNLANIVGNVDLLYKTKVAEALRQGMTDILAKMESNSNFHLIPWEAGITGVNQDSRLVAFNAGDVQGVRVGDLYTLYSHCEANDANCFERYLADVRVTRVGPQSAEAVAHTDSDSVANAYLGDKVYVKRISASGAQ